MGGRRPDGCITEPRNTMMEESRWGGGCREEWRVPFEGSEGLEGSMALNMEV